MYLNSTAGFAVTSALLQIFTEIIAKCWTIYSLKARERTFEWKTKIDGRKLRAMALRKNVTVTIPADGSARRNYRLGMIAVRFTSEIIAEKTCIIIGMLVAML